MKHRDVLFGLKEIPGIGEKTIRKLREAVHRLDELPSMDVADMMRLGIEKRRALLIKRTLNESFVDERLELYRKSGIRTIVLGDQDYPKLLASISYPPTVLYVKGDPSLLSHPSIAVVGTRRATVYGKRATRKLVSELAGFGFGIVSGMARGIDTEAHRTSLTEGVPSVAVLGTGHDIAYPKENKPLIDRMAEEGAVVSEIPLGQPIRQGLFYVRNRIIAGLSLGTLVVEADENSGALITARYADEEHRDVFAVPGSIFSSQSGGTLSWIRSNRAKCVSCGADIACEYKHVVPGLRRPEQPRSQSPLLSEDERLVLSYLSEQEATIDDLLVKTNFSFGHLHTVLLSLLIKKQIKKCSGSVYACTH
mgnify:CR=1 FL=1|jgi:DNA processing protein